MISGHPVGQPPVCGLGGRVSLVFLVVPILHGLWMCLKRYYFRSFLVSVDRRTALACLAVATTERFKG